MESVHRNIWTNPWDQARECVANEVHDNIWNKVWSQTWEKLAANLNLWSQAWEVTRLGFKLQITQDKENMDNSVIWRHAK